MEYTKYLHLKFENAGFFRDMSRTKDFVFDLDGKKKRVDFVQYVEPINVNHISNALHVLCGERPVPSLRKSKMIRIDEIFELAKNGYIKIDSVKLIDEAKNISQYTESTLIMRKSVYNSFSKAPETITWERIRRLLENDLNDEFLELMNSLFEVDVKATYNCNDAMEILRDRYINRSEVAEFIKVLKRKLKQPMIDFINGRQKVSQASLLKNPNAIGAMPTFNSNIRTLITTNMGIDKITRISGEIIVPINDFYLEKIRNNKGFAKLLDGGILYVSNVFEEYEMDDLMLLDFVKIDSISTETKNCKQIKQSTI